MTTKQIEIKYLSLDKQETKSIILEIGATGRGWGVFYDGFRILDASSEAGAMDQVEFIKDNALALEFGKITTERIKKVFAIAPVSLDSWGVYFRGELIAAAPKGIQATRFDAGEFAAALYSILETLGDPEAADLSQVLTVAEFSRKHRATKQRGGLLAKFRRLFARWF